MNYVLKVNSPYITNDWRRRNNSVSIPSNKIYFLGDEKSIFNFLRAQMKQDLLYPVSGNIRYSKETVTPADTLGLFSYLSSAEGVDFHFLCYSGRVNKFIRQHIGTQTNVWSKLAMLRSMPFNYTLYKLQDGVGGSKVLQNINWNRFIKFALKQKTITDDDLKYVVEK